MVSVWVLVASRIWLRIAGRPELATHGFKMDSVL